jgi:hypothetical protein
MFHQRVLGCEVAFTGEVSPDGLTLCVESEATCSLAVGGQPDNTRQNESFGLVYFLQTLDWINTLFRNGASTR